MSVCCRENGASNSSERCAFLVTKRIFFFFTTLFLSRIYFLRAYFCLLALGLKELIANERAGIMPSLNKLAIPQYHSFYFSHERKPGVERQSMTEAPLLFLLFSLNYNGMTELLWFGKTNNAKLQKFSDEIEVLLEEKLCRF